MLHHQSKGFVLAEMQSDFMSKKWDPKASNQGAVTMLTVICRWLSASKSPQCHRASAIVSRIYGKHIFTECSKLLLVTRMGREVDRRRLQERCDQAAPFYRCAD